MSNLSVHYSSQKEDWATPRDLFAEFDEEFGPFVLDAAASAENAKCAEFFTVETDGLNQPWHGKVWINPPYGRSVPQWLHKAILETKVLRRAERAVFLLPARTDTAAFHDLIKPYADVVRFLRGRVTFEGAKHPAPFPSMVVVFDRPKVSELAIQGP